ncbi:MAG TPA: flippase activity-associated protein Agl23 [Chloroflexia bacterium]|jgi:uncharacterized protein (TIGR03663 family)
MDNRRFSARADAGASYPGRRDARDIPFVPLFDRAIELTRLNWEIIFFVGLIAITVLTRLWDLGPRALHHDESIHAYYSNWFLKSGNYTTTDMLRFQGGYDPTYHGPFLYFMTALGYLLFGTTDAISRLMPALFGILLVGLCWLLRPFIGRVGAMVAALLIVLSPSISYYSRSLRHDIFALTGTMLLFVAILWFLRTHQAKWVYLGALGFAIAFSSHELTYMIAFMFVGFMVISAFSRLSNSYQPNFGALLVMVAGIVLSIVGLMVGAYFSTLPEPEALPGVLAFTVGIALTALGFYFVSRTGLDAGDEDEVNPVRSAAASFLRQPWTLLLAALIFFGIYIVLFTNLLTKPQLVLSGFVESLRYWLGEHKTARGNQPLFYYLMLMFVYEPLAFFAGFGTMIYMFFKWIFGNGDRPSPANDVDVADTGAHDEYGQRLPLIGGLRGFTLAFLAFWSIGALMAFSLAGERMPWLNMQNALPFSLLAAAGIGRLLASVEWREVWKGGGAFLGVIVVLFIFAAFVLVAFLTGAMPAPIGESAGFQSGMRAVLLFLFTFGLLAGAGWLAYKLLPGRAIKVVAVTFAVILLAYGLRSMMLLNYRHGDVPIELLVYTQSAPDVPIVADMIQRLSRDETAFDAGRSPTDVTGGRGLSVAIDTNESITWPFNWYLRDMRDIKYFDTTAWTANQANIIAPNQPVILASDATEGNANFQAFIKDKYTSQRYVLNWWFPEEAYKKDNQGDLGTAIGWLMGKGMKYMLYRDPGLPLGSRNFYLHIRNDLAVKAGVGAATGVPVATNTNGGPSPDGPIYGMLDLAPAGVERGQFNLPRTITTDAQGNFYVVDTANMRIQKFDSTGKFVAIIGSGRGEGEGQFKPYDETATGTGPGGIAADKAGNIYVADTWNHRIQKFDATGKFVTQWGSYTSLGDAAAAGDPAVNTKFWGPRGIALDAGGNVYVTDTGNKRVMIFDGNGKYLRQIASGMSPEKIASAYPFNQPGEMNEPIGIAVDGSGAVYVADTNNRRIQKFDAAGKFVAQWPVGGTNWDAGPYLEPFLALDSAGNLYVAAPTGRKILKFNATGQPLAEKSAQGAVSLKTPTGVTVAADGSVYVVDVGSNGVVNLGTIP